jgi:haloacid dehalogenase-like hydrolase
MTIVPLWLLPKDQEVGHIKTARDQTLILSRNNKMASFSGFTDRSMQKSTAAQLEGALLISSDIFPYFVLVALEAGGPLRAVTLLLFYPLFWLLNITHHRTVALHAMIFICTFGLKVHAIKEVAMATLQKFFLEDLQEKALKIFSGCEGKKYVLTCLPRIMVEPFLREYLDVDCVIGTELKVIGRTCSGLVVPIGADMAKMGWFHALKVAREDDQLIDVGLAVRNNDRSFLLLCKVIHICFPLHENFYSLHMLNMLKFTVESAEMAKRTKFSMQWKDLIN